MLNLITQTKLKLIFMESIKSTIASQTEITSFKETSILSTFHSLKSKFSNAKTLLTTMSANLKKK